MRVNIQLTYIYSYGPQITCNVHSILTSHHQNRESESKENSKRTTCWFRRLTARLVISSFMTESDTFSLQIIMLMIWYEFLGFIGDGFTKDESLPLSGIRVNSCWIIGIYLYDYGCYIDSIISFVEIWNNLELIVEFGC